MLSLMRNRSTMIVIMLLIIAAALSKAKNIPLSLFPATQRPTVVAWLSPPDINSDDFIQNWGKDIEAQLKSINNVEQVNGRYYPRSFSFQTRFSWDQDPEEALQLVKNKLANIENRFPSSWNPFWIRMDNSQSGMIAVGLRSSKIPIGQLNDIIDQRVLPKIREIPNIANAGVVRTDEYDYEILVQQEELIKYNINLNQVRQNIDSSARDFALGEFKAADGETFKIRGLNKVDQIDSLKMLVIAWKQGKPIRLRDIAKFHQKPKIPWAYFRANGKATSVIYVSPEPTANIKKVADLSMEIIKSEIYDVDPDMNHYLFLDPARFINNAISNVSLAVILGMVIAGSLVYLFFGSIRIGLLIGVSMPLSLAGGFILMDLLNISVNLLSLGGMALAVGMVIDGAVVIIENIQRHIENEKTDDYDLYQIIAKSVKEVLPAVTASILTTTVVFLPLSYTAPLAAAILGDLAKVIICVLLVSLVVSSIFIPVLFSFQSKKNISQRKMGEKRAPLTTLLAVLRSAYIRSLHKIINNKAYQNLILSGAAILFITSLIISAVYLPRIIISETKSDMISLRFDFKQEGLTTEEKIELIAPVEKKLMENFGDHFKSIFSQMSRWNTKVYALLNDPKEFDQILQEVEEIMPNSVDYNVRVKGWAPTSLKTPNPPDFRIGVTGKNDDAKRETLGKISDELNKIEGLTGIRTKPGIWKSNDLVLDFDENKLRKFEAYKNGSLTKATITNLISYSIKEKYIRDLYVDDKEIALKLKLDPGIDLIEPGDFGNILFRIGDDVVPIRAFVNIRPKSYWGLTLRENGRQIYHIDARLNRRYKDKNKDDFQTKIQEALLNANIDQNTWHFEETMGEINSNISSLITALAWSVLLLLLVISIQFGNMKQAIMILGAIPLGYIGVTISMFIFSQPISINSMLGLILLSGTAVNNSILIVDFINRAKKNENLSKQDIIIQSAELRFRPILITVLTTIIGMLPVAIGMGQGGEILQVLGVTISGGLGVSTILTLYIIPILAYRTSYDVKVASPVKVMA